MTNETPRPDDSSNAPLAGGLSESPAAAHNTSSHPLESLSKNPATLVDLQSPTITGPDPEKASKRGPSDDLSTSQIVPEDLQTPATNLESEETEAEWASINHASNISVDHDWVNDADSALGEDASTYSTSLSSDVWTHSYEYGRRYHAYKDSEYIRPNDETEVDRLDMMHHIFKVMQGSKLFEAPIPKTVQNVLDLGCGTGLWCMEFGDEYPSAEILGIDLSPIQPNFVPPNVKFEIDDIELDFQYPKPFDYIHCRYMAYAIKDWPRLVKQVYEHTAPNGFAEFIDYDLTYRSDDGSLDNTTLKFWGDEMPRAGRLMGREPSPGLKLETWMREAGFVNLVHKVYKIPIGPWPADKHLKALGAYNYMMLSQGAEGFSLRLFINVLGWSYEEVQVLLAKVRRDFKDRSIHAYTEIHCVYGQKAESA